MIETKTYIKLPPEANDGQHWTVHGVDDGPKPLGDVLLTWMMEAEVGDKITLEIVEMHPDVVAKLPEF